VNIHSTIKALYSIMCEAQTICGNPDKGTGILSSLLRSVSDDDVVQATSELEWMLEELKAVSDAIKGMYILHYVTGTDRDNKTVLLQTEVVFGSKTVKFITQFDEKATQSLIDALGMSLAMLKAGDKLVGEGNA
jgi:hypothetical protein